MSTRAMLGLITAAATLTGVLLPPVAAGVCWFFFALLAVALVFMAVLKHLFGDWRDIQSIRRSGRDP